MTPIPNLREEKRTKIRDAQSFTDAGGQVERNIFFSWGKPFIYSLLLVIVWFLLDFVGSLRSIDRTGLIESKVYADKLMSSHKDEMKLRVEEHDAAMKRLERMDRNLTAITMFMQTKFGMPRISDKEGN